MTHNLRVVERRQDDGQGYVKQDVEDADYSEYLGDPRQGAPPVALGNPESRGGEWPRAGDHEHE